MAKSLKYKEYLKEYGRSILTGSVIILGLVALAGSIHHFLAFSLILSFMLLAIYIIWRTL